MNIIAIMGPHGVFYKDEPIKELESALVAQGFQIIWPISPAICLHQHPLDDGCQRAGYADGALVF